MDKLNYTKLMALQPTEYKREANKLGQEIVFYEHPLRGDEYPIIAVLHEKQIAVCTDFFDTDDFYTDSEYMPVYAHGKMLCQWEIDL